MVYYSLFSQELGAGASVFLCLFFCCMTVKVVWRRYSACCTVHLALYLACIPCPRKPLDVIEILQNTQTMKQKYRTKKWIDSQWVMMIRMMGSCYLITVWHRLQEMQSKGKKNKKKRNEKKWYDKDAKKAQNWTFSMIEKTNVFFHAIQNKKSRM